jgi:hypothetical protein
MKPAVHQTQGVDARTFLELHGKSGVAKGLVRYFVFGERFVLEEC